MSDASGEQAGEDVKNALWAASGAFHKQCVFVVLVLVRARARACAAWLAWSVGGRCAASLDEGRPNTRAQHTPNPHTYTPNTHTPTHIRARACARRQGRAFDRVLLITACEDPFATAPNAHDLKCVCRAFFFAPPRMHA